MAIISRKGSNLVREVHEKQSMNKSRQRFWELAALLVQSLVIFLVLKKSAEQIDADTAVVRRTVDASVEVPANSWSGIQGTNLSVLEA
ncbi:RNA helicase family protein [Artemisia annua]|uniref:RNA helicase family protein n=1 Tax=Artemisia annua TaxID=35608 RepID=A0A2U1NK87_ARTAN|nr:RNA helicase family protein [Artemisia annua]